MGGSNLSAPNTPTPVSSTFSYGDGSSATTSMNGNNVTEQYNPNAFQTQQTQYYQNLLPQLENSTFNPDYSDINRITQANRDIFNNNFTTDANNLMDQMNQNFYNNGQDDSSAKDYAVNKFGQQEMNVLGNFDNQQIANAYNLRDQNLNYNNKLLGLADNGLQSLYTNANNSLNGATNGFNSGNQFNESNYNTLANMYNTQQKINQQNSNQQYGEESAILNSLLGYVAPKSGSMPNLSALNSASSLAEAATI